MTSSIGVRTTPVPVSYTHLDVYKRQALAIGGIMVMIFALFYLDIGGMSTVLAIGLGLIGIGLGMLPVSYTHLISRGKTTADRPFWPLQCRQKLADQYAY